MTNSPDVKAAMARATSAGVEAKFLRVAKSGRDEIWSINDVLMVLPAVPAHCPSDLEFALRLRRDAMLTGACEKCGAVADYAALMGEQTGRIPTAAAFFNHKAKCPARDENVKRKLASFYRARRNSTRRERWQAAQMSTRQVMRGVAERSARVDISSNAHGVRIAQETLDRLLGADDVTRCGHLHADPNQTWTISIADKRWFCLECFERWGLEVQRGFNLGVIEESTCDICRRYTPSGLSPLIWRIDLWIMRGGACRRCMAKFDKIS